MAKFTSPPVTFDLAHQGRRFKLLSPDLCGQCDYEYTEDCEQYNQLAGDILLCLLRVGVVKLQSRNPNTCICESLVRY